MGSNPLQGQPMKRLHLDIDQALIFLLLAVTVSQLAAYLSRYTGIVIAWCQAIAIDAAIWRCGFWFRRYTGPKQRRLALLGLVAFSLVSAWYNHNYYRFADPSLPSWQCWLMGAILPAGVALLSYLYGTKDASRFGHGAELRKAEQDSGGNAEHTKTEPVHVAAPSFACESPGCHFVADSQNGLNAHGRAHGNGHERVGVKEVQSASSRE